MKPTLAKTVQPVQTLLITLITRVPVLTTLFSPEKTVKLTFYALRVLAKTRELARILWTILATIVVAPLTTPELTVKNGFRVV